MRLPYHECLLPAADKEHPRVIISVNVLLLWTQSAVITETPQRSGTVCVSHTTHNMLHCNTSFLNPFFSDVSSFAEWNLVPPWPGERRGSGGYHCRGGVAGSGGGVGAFSSTHLPS